MRINEPITDREIPVPAAEPLVSRTDPGGRITFVNRSFAGVSGFTEAELVGSPHNLVRHPHMPKAAFADLWATLKAGRPWEGLVKNRSKTGDFYWVRANVTPELTAGKVTGYISIRSQPSRAQAAAAEAAYARMRAGTARNLGLRDGEIVSRSPMARLRQVAASITGRLLAAAAVVVAALGLAGWPGLSGSAAGLAAALGGLATIGCGVLVLLAIRRPLRRLEAHLTALAQGDLTREIELPAAGEFGPAFSLLRALRARLAFAEQERLEQERRVAIARREAVRDMATRIEAVADEAVGGMVERAAEMARNAEDVAQSAARVGGNAEAVAGAARLSQGNAQAVAAAAEQLSASIREISSQVAHASDVARRGTGDGHRAQDTVRGLADSTSRIGDVARLIEDIASRTNLLALNATIEAARAGEAGKGFAVVAGEVKALAAQTAKATLEITQQIGAIQAETQTSVTVIEGVGRTIGEIAEVTVAVAAAVEQQAAATREISRNIAETTGAAQEVSDRIAEVSREAAETGRRAGEMQAASAAVAGNTTALRRTINHVVRTASADADRRLHARHPAGEPCTLLLGGERHGTVLSNISRGGALLALPEGARVGERGSLVLDRRGGARAAVEVLECDPESGGTRLRFTAEALEPAFEAALAALTAGKRAQAA
ncbi:methyl-accepting chemotaxis protein [Siccirubricoccus sp. G192]|uniref:methyl-accepting chemotaxis protein n=1 Tax=Siccirubricoccus sp. G192 TaxID=2849651 RepID=UPI001C2BBB9F|nr:methyl-accepting chemotaxis protein [Siccirubricoccus sp. G192]MBV1799730.1 PAS domain-containing protein [Siccirubricoccus sp. G192]